MVTIRDIAEECGVSIATVSNYLNGKKKMSSDTEQKIRAAIERTGYKPNAVAKGLRSHKSGMIGIVVEDISQFTIPDMVEGVMRHFESCGYHAIVKNLRLYTRWSDTWFNNEARINEVLDPALDELTSMMVDGLIYIAVHGRETSLIPDYIQIPSVMVYAIEERADIPSVVVDDEYSAYEAVNYLIEYGHKKIGVVAGREDNMHTVLRLHGYRRAMSEHGLEVDDSLICYADWSMDGAYRKAGPLLERDITALFCMADRMAGGVYRLLNERGKTAGRDLSVIGFDNQDMAAYFMPELTTMALPLIRIGEKAASILTDRLGGINSGESTNLIRIPCRLVERRSVMKI